MDDLNDAELIHRFRNGQVQAFNLLVWRWQKPVLNFLYRFLGNVQDAEDVNQRTFLKVYQKLSSLRQTDKFQIWLYQVAANEARDQLRRRSRGRFFSIGGAHGEGDDPPVPEIPDTSKESMEDRIHQSELRKIFEQAMQEIPAEQRLVIIMKIYQDLKFVEIADILQESLNTVKSRMYYGLKALREVLQRQNFSKEVLQYEM